MLPKRFPVLSVSQIPVFRSMRNPPKWLTVFRYRGIAIALGTLFGFQQEEAEDFSAAACADILVLNLLVGTP
jgi:hypothetical protein